LDLTNNNISDVGTHALVDALFNNKSLERLLLPMNENVSFPKGYFTFYPFAGPILDSKAWGTSEVPCWEEVLEALNPVGSPCRVEY